MPTRDIFLMLAGITLAAIVAHGEWQVIREDKQREQYYYDREFDGIVREYERTV